MDRKEFIEKFAIGTGAVVATACLAGCFKKVEKSDDAKKGQLIIDLEEKGSEALKVKGGYIYKKGLVIAHLDDGSYAALKNKCSHQGGPLVYRGDQDLFHCKLHGSKFNTKGKVLNGPAQINLPVYDVRVEDNKLIIQT